MYGHVFINSIIKIKISAFGEFQPNTIIYNIKNTAQDGGGETRSPHHHTGAVGLGFITPGESSRGGGHTT